MELVARPRLRARRVLSLLLAGALVLLGSLSLHRPVLAQPLRQVIDPALLSFAPSADLSVVSTANLPADSAGRLRLGRQAGAVSYMHFEVSGVGDLAVERAILRVYAYDASPAGFSVQALAEGTWAAGSTVPGHKPRPGRVIAVSGTHFAGQLT